MAPSKSVELFRGNCTAEKAHIWIRTLHLTWKYDADPKEKLYKFLHALFPGGQAEEWWNSLKATERTDWDELMKAFEVKWPVPKATSRDQDVVVQELKENLLSRDVLGKYVQDEDDTSVLSHVAWTEVTRRLISELPEGDKAMLLKSTVRNTLPVELRALIPETGLDTWEKYLTAIAAISVDRINDAVETRTSRDDAVIGWFSANRNATPAQLAAHQEEFATKLMNDLGLAHFAPTLSSPSRSAASPGARYVPPAARHSQPTPARTPMYQPTPAPGPRSYQTPPAAEEARTPWANRTSPDVFGGTTVKPALPSAFTKSLLSTPGSPSAGRGRPSSLSGDPARDIQLAQHIAQNPRLYANDAAGHQHYSTDMSVWMSQNGNSASPDYTTFPLSPGTAAAGSKECFRCGMLTVPSHFGRAQCMAQNGREVPTREQNIRGMVGAIVHPPGSRTPRIAQIQEAPYDPFGGRNADQPIFEEDESENGEEPAV
ncbi:hypothetical protein C8R47DRAFT_644786 [Mycena vitilis]|nr:hypothetical protein C8R47DRAFT_644786 [Mycena vitilis]